MIETQEQVGQYSLAKVLTLWLIVTAPMGVLAWVVAPWLIPQVSLPAGITYWLLMIVGMFWQFVVSTYVLWREKQSGEWHSLKDRLWLRAPVNPKTGETSHLRWLWVLPAVAFAVLVYEVAIPLDDTLGALVPSLSMPSFADIAGLNDPQFHGAYYLLLVAITSSVFNYLLGEELFFRGVLLPRMIGVFGKWAWLANAFLFGIYHIHKFWSLPSIIISNLAISWPAQRFRSNWLAVIVHGVEGLFLLALVAALVFGVGM